MKKIVIIGFGSIAKKHIWNLKFLYPNATIYVISSRGYLIKSEMDGVIFLTDMSQAIDINPDFAIIASPATFHYVQAQALLSANIPTLIEKPITADVQDALSLIKSARQFNGIVAVGYCLRYLSSAQIIKKLIEENKIGSIYNVSAHAGQYLPSWRKDKEFMDSVSVSKKLGGGVLLELSHELDYLQWLLGELNYNYSILRNTNDLNLEVEEIADIILTTVSGCVCTVHMNFVQKHTQRYCHFIGKKGYIYWDLVSNTVILYLNDQKPKIFDQSSWDKNNMYLLMIREFVERIKNKDHANVTLMQAFRTVELIEQIKMHADWGVKQ